MIGGGLYIRIVNSYFLDQWEYARYIVRRSHYVCQPSRMKGTILLMSLINSQYGEITKV